VQVRLEQGLGCLLYLSVARALRVTDQQFLRHQGMRWRAVFDYLVQLVSHGPTITRESRVRIGVIVARPAGRAPQVFLMGSA